MTALLPTTEGLSPVLVEVVRSGVVESYHRGSYVVLDPTGAVLDSAGDVEVPVFPRSSLKPLQAVGLVRTGLLKGTDALHETDVLALAAASHNGEDRHATLARRMLLAVGLAPDDLACPPALPLEESLREAYLRGGGRPERLRHNCSGKHAGMLATCVARGWPVEGYTDPQAPVQLAIRTAVEELTGATVAAVAVDGCGAPQLAVPLTGLARAFGRLVTAADGSAELAVADAMRDRPYLVAGSGRQVTALMEQTPGLLLKEGAEGVYAGALQDGTAFAVKVDDGAMRAADVFAASLLVELGVENATVLRYASAPVLGGGQPVGVVRTVAALFDVST